MQDFEQKKRALDEPELNLALESVPSQAPSLSWITARVAIGNFLDAQNKPLIVEGGFRSALSLDGTLRDKAPDEIGVRKIVTVELIDGRNSPSVFRNAIKQLVKLAALDPPVLVQCHAGRSRAVAVVAGYLAKTQHISVDKALEQISAVRQIALDPALEGLLRRFF